VPSQPTASGVLSTFSTFVCSVQLGGKMSIQAAFLAQQNLLALQQIQDESLQFIKPSATTPSLDTSTWPLLLKNYDKLLVRSAHYTPVPAGSSPLKRDLASYLK
jgi:hypothetical protein